MTALSSPGLLPAAWHHPNLIQYSCVYNSNLHRNSIYINIYQTHLDSRYADTDDEKNIYLDSYNVDDGKHQLPDVTNSDIDPKWL